MEHRTVDILEFAAWHPLEAIDRAAFEGAKRRPKGFESSSPPSTKDSHWFTVEPSRVASRGGIWAIAAACGLS